MKTSIQVTSTIADSPTKNSSAKNADVNKVAFVQASWHKDIVDQLTTSFTTEITSLTDFHIDFFTVPGAFELPLHCQQLAQSGKYRAIVAAGLVVNGGIYRHEFVGKAVIDGFMRVQLDTGVPVFSAVLTPHHFHDTHEHHHFFKEHFVIKGKEVAVACANTLASLEAIAA